VNSELEDRAYCRDDREIAVERYLEEDVSVEEVTGVQNAVVEDDMEIEFETTEPAPISSVPLSVPIVEVKKVTPAPISPSECQIPIESGPIGLRETTPETNSEPLQRWLSEIQLLLTGEMKERLTEIIGEFSIEDYQVSCGMNELRNSVPEHLLSYVSEMSKTMHAKIIGKCVNEAIETLINILTGRIGQK